MDSQINVCSCFRKCGGCSLQHIPYESQLANKKAFVQSAFSKRGWKVPESFGITPSNPFGYRSRMDFSFFPGGIGFRRKGSFSEIVPVSSCIISNERVNALLSEIRSWLGANKSEIIPFSIGKCSGVLKFAVVRASLFSDSSCVSFAISSESQQSASQIELIKKFAESSSSENVVISRIPAKTDTSTSPDFFAVKGSTMMNEKICGINLKFSSQGFFQNNPAVAREMVSHVRNIFSSYETKDAVLLDLYGGVGTFGLCSADIFRKCIVADSFQPGIDCASLNIRENNIINAEAVCLPSSSIKSRAKELGITGQNLFIILDPPRQGIDQKTAAFIRESMPKAFIYVSCNPLQLAKDLIAFRQHYTLESLRAFDMFPQTNHIEAVAEMRLKH